MRFRKNVRLSFLMSVVMVVTLFTSSVSAFATSGVATEATTTAPEQAQATTQAQEAADAKAKAQAEIDARNNARKNQIAQIDNELKAEEQKQQEYKAKINEVAKKVNEKQAVVEYIDSQISTTKNEINLLESKIVLLEEDIDAKVEEIDAKIAEYDRNYQTFLDRLRAMYMYDSSNTLGLVLGTDNYVDFLTTNDNINRIAAHDEKLMQELNEERLALLAEKKSLEEKQDSLEESSKIAESKKAELAEQQGVAQAQVYEVAALQKEFEQDLAASKAKSKQMKSEMDNIYAQMETLKEDYAGGVMAWPVPGYKQISSYFGWRFGGTDYHTGVDITGGGVHGKNVVAANSGEVVLVNWSHSPGSGYGMYVIVDHGGGVTTLYAHLSNIYVSKGQRVARGEAVGAVGSTGWSTGPHLHFEVRTNKEAKDPLGYIS